MKKILTAVAVVVFFVAPAICFSSYIIHLKDGRKFATDRYYEEGDQLKFKRFGGIIGIKKDQVKEIEEIEDAPEEKAEAVKPESPSAGEKADDVKKAGVPEDVEKASEDVVGKEEGDKSEEKKATGKKEKEEKKTDIAQYEREKRALKEKYREARKELGRSINAGDKLGSEAAKSEMAEILDRFSEMERKIKKEEGTKK